MLEVRGLPGRAGESLVMFVGVLVASVFLLTPGQSETALGIELIVGGVVLAALLVLIVLPGIRMPTRQPLSWRIVRIFSVLAASLPVAAAGVSVLAERGGGLYWFVAAVVISFVAGIANAWVLLVEGVRDERYRPVRGDDVR